MLGMRKLSVGLLFSIVVGVLCVTPHVRAATPHASGDALAPVLRGALPASPQHDERSHPSRTELLNDPFQDPNSGGHFHG